MLPWVGALPPPLGKMLRGGGGGAGLEEAQLYRGGGGGGEGLNKRSFIKGGGLEQAQLYQGRGASLWGGGGGLASQGRSASLGLWSAPPPPS